LHLSAPNKTDRESTAATNVLFTDAAGAVAPMRASQNWRAGKPGVPDNPQPKPA
jgi:hypothetical protein